jgi:hypothetical protein
MLPDGGSDDGGDRGDASSGPSPSADGGTRPGVMRPDGSSGDGGVVLDSGAHHNGATDSGTSDDELDAGPLYPAGRLFVSMEDSAPAVWDDVSSITMDSAPTFTLGDSSLASGTRGMVLAKKRLFIGTPQAKAALVAFDGAEALGSSTVPAAKIPLSQLIATAKDWSSWSPDQLVWDARSDSLWVGNQLGTEHFSGAHSISSSSTAKALFTHPWHQLPGVAYDPIGDRLLLGQISGAGLLAYDGASSASGTPEPSFVLLPSSPAWSLSIDGGRLYAMIPGGNSSTPATLAVWKDIASASAAKAPSFTMGENAELYGFAEFVTVNSNVLIACMQSGEVHLWTHASALSADTAPTQTITLAAEHSPKKALLGAVSGRLYVMDDEGIAIYATPITAPTLVTKLKSGIEKPVDFAVLE